MCLAVPGQVMTIQDDPLRTGTVSFAGVTKSVSLAMVPEAQVGDYVIVHVGFAISRLDEAAARRSLELYRAMAEQQARPHGGRSEL
ncbi:MAG: HypC/HybG/HupF family hydrogenase formation chaperone [Nitrospirae bacterium]|nr:HypC/HybG/HupF family hydrogenase formation chaperone [Nitrospirota bacterium]